MSEKIQSSDIQLKETADQPELAVSAVSDSAVLKQAQQDDGVQTSQVNLTGFHDLELIAQGASGSVYSARRDGDNKSVAVKIYQKELIPNADSVRRFEHEIDTLKRLSHPNIVKILGSGTAPSGQSYIVMENVEGKNLRKMLDANGPFAPKQAATVAREVCRALTAAHENGIIHRDLKPNNIILDDNNIAKVVDFGIAKAVGSSNDTITEYGAVIGTPAYMSPEQCLNQKVDERSDVYSLGCTLFELLTNEKAFEAETAMTALAKQINKDRSHLKPILDKHEVPPALEQIVLKCLDRDPEKRYKSAAELDHALSGYLLEIQQQTSSQTPMSKSTQIVLFVCALVAILVIFETTLFHARETIEANPGHPTPLANIGSVINPHAQLNSSTGAFEIRNRRTGVIIFTEKYQGLTFNKLIQDAAAQGVSLAFADLQNADMTQIDVSNADFQNADLTGARFTQAKLFRDKFDGAILTGAKFGQAQINRCSFRDAKMSSAYFVQTKSRNSDYRDTDMTNTNLIQAYFTNCDLRSADLTGANYIQAEFKGTDITYAKMPARSRFDSPNIHGSIIHGATIQ